MAREAVLAAEARELVIHHLLGLHEGGAVAAAQRGGRPGMPALLPRRVLGHANTRLFCCRLGTALNALDAVLVPCCWTSDDPSEGSRHHKYRT